MKKIVILMLAVVGMLTIACTMGGEYYDINTLPNEQQGSGNNSNNDDDSSSDPNDPSNPLNKLTCAPNEILYTTMNNLVIELGNAQGFGGNLLYNTYENGIGKLTFSNDVIAIPQEAFHNCRSMEYIKMPHKIKSIGKRAFDICSNLKSVTIPNCVTSIGEQAFYFCSSLTRVIIPDSVTSIGDWAFYNCTSLTRVDYQGVLLSWIEIGFGSSGSNPCYNGAKLYLNGCELTDITIPSDITEINMTFSGCTSLTSVIIPNSVTSIGPSAFSNCTSLKSVTIGNGVTSIESHAFSGCTSLTSITIPDSVTSIGDLAFYNCISLTSVTIPDSVTSIGRSAFSFCTLLTSVTIANSVTSIGDGAFYKSTSLLEVYCKSLTPPTPLIAYEAFGWYAFDNNASGRKIYVPTASVEAYKAAKYWSEYASYIVGYDF